ncbi:MAG: long-chain fatty acid--CoA ligase [Myxococcales bacterium]|nr:long-chain fatty acid--CoA ligase [Polyangiaceae bacterium]MDW8249130.1 long-chain fatty acid--CoA ligase [Myxococcales bacterium]
MTVYCDWLGRRAALTPEKVALLDRTGGRRIPITYRDWDRQVNRTARWLREVHRIRRGDRVAILANNSVAYLDLLFACGKLGAILQTLNWRLTPAELYALLVPALPTLLVHNATTREQVRTLASSGLVLPVMDLDGAGEHSLQGRESYSDAPIHEEIRPEDPWIICYTGGSTGVPKGAVLTHGSVVANAVNTVAGWGMTQDDVAILNAPLFHVGGLNVLTTPLVLVGGTSIVCDGFDPGQVFELIQSEGVTAFFGVPTMFLALLQHPRWSSADLSQVRLVISGGAPCPEAILQAFWERGVGLRTGYGLTEAGPNNFGISPELAREKPGSVGFPLFLVETRLVADGRECGDDEVGELWIRGPHVFGGYWGCPDETAKAMEGGWLRTGDLARRDREGCYWIVGRIKDLIISGGENVYPAEVEGVLMDHPSVAEAAVIGVPDERWGEVGRALIVPREGHPQDAEALLAFCRERLARYKVPKEIRWLDALPRTAAGKIDKPALRRDHGAR